MTVRSAVEKAREPGKALQEAMDAGKVSHSSILKSVGIDAASPVHQAALLAADKYGLDPLLKHIIVIPGSGLYITRDGYLHVAHRETMADGRRAFDGMEVVEEGETSGYWFAKVAVYRKDMGRPFIYLGRYPKQGKNKQYGPEMAVKVAEVAAMRRAFPVAVPHSLGAWEERWDTVDTDVEVETIPEPEPAPEPEPEPAES